jgi:hypothetical protein
LGAVFGPAPANRSKVNTGKPDIFFLVLKPRVTVQVSRKPREAAESGTGMEAGIKQKSAPAPKRRPTAEGRAAREKRTFARLSEGWATNAIARAERKG